MLWVFVLLCCSTTSAAPSVKVFLTYSDAVADMAGNAIASLIATGVLPTDITAKRIDGTGEGHYQSTMYYHFLRAKLDYFRGVIQSHFGETVLLIDADVQVFRGWQELLTVGDVAMVTQREGSSINTGVVLLKCNPATLQIYSLAWDAFGALKRTASEDVKGHLLGDQTAIANVLAKAPYKYMYQRFSRKHVNAGVIEAQLSTVLVHHAHMSGRHKRYNLRKAVGFVARKRGLGLGVHTLCFLDGNCSGREVGYLEVMRVMKGTPTVMLPTEGTPSPTAVVVVVSSTYPPPPSLDEGWYYLYDLLAVIVVTSSLVVLRCLWRSRTTAVKGH